MAPSSAVARRIESTSTSLLSSSSARLGCHHHLCAVTGFHHCIAQDANLSRIDLSLGFLDGDQGWPRALLHTSLLQSGENAQCPQGSVGHLRRPEKMGSAVLQPLLEEQGFFLAFQKELGVTFQDGLRANFDEAGKDEGRYSLMRSATSFGGTPRRKNTLARLLPSGDRNCPGSNVTTSSIFRGLML